jgi:hypothetical protein
MKGLFLGAFLINMMMAVITLSAFGAGKVTIFYPIAHLAVGYLCWYKSRGY